MEVWLIYLILTVNGPILLPGTFPSRDACVAASERNNKTLDKAGLAAITVCMESHRGTN